jgi:hypothetical protein
MILVKAEKRDNSELDALWRSIHQRVADRMAASFKRLGFKTAPVAAPKRRRVG